MKRLARGIAGAGLAAFLLAGWTGTGEAKAMASPWRPGFGSPVNFYQIQVDHDTPASGVVRPIYERQQEIWPDAADHAGPRY